MFYIGKVFLINFIMCIFKYISVFPNSDGRKYMASLNNRVSIVTGAARGIGLTISKALLDHGGKVRVLKSVKRGVRLFLIPYIL